MKTFLCLSGSINIDEDSALIALFLKLFVMYEEKTIRFKIMVCDSSAPYILPLASKP